MVNNKSKTGSSKRWQDIIQFAIGIIVLILLNIIVSQFFFRIDLTEDKRYTISPATKNILRSLDDVVYVEVYLEGEFPAGFERLQRSIRETLDEFRVYGGTNIEYKFIDPNAETDTKARGRFYRQLAEKGLQPTNLFANENGQRVEKLIFPGAVVSYGDKEQAVMLLRGNQAASSAERLNQSVEGVEYELAAAIKTLTQQRNKRVAIIRGHGELPDEQLFDLVGTMRQSYKVESVVLPEVDNLNGFEAIVVAKPTKSFSEQDKFKIDQYIINGGKALFFVDAVNINLDSIGENGALGLPYNLNLEDMFFRYGVRLNPDLIQDLHSAYIPLFVGYMGDQPRTQPVNWRYYPVINQFGKHPVVRNMDAIYSKFTGTIDTVKAAGIVKTPLLYTSRYSKVSVSPITVSFNEARVQPDPAQYNKGPLPVAFLLEGRFKSLYTNRQSPFGPQVKVTEQNKPSKILFCSDGDIIANEFNSIKNEAFPLGYDQLARVTFSNKEFAMNALEYMLDENGLILTRAKEIQMRPLDKLKIKEERTLWQVLNVVAPLCVVGVFGLVRYYMRKKRWERF